MWQVWLVWILTTERKSWKRVVNFERYVIFSCCHLFILLIKQILFYYVHLLSRYILQTVFPSRYLSFSTCSALNPICSFVFEWRNFLGIWMMPRFSFCGVYLCFHTVLTTESVIIPLACIEQWWWRSSVAAFVLQLLFSQLWDRICFILLVAVTDKALSTR